MAATLGARIRKDCDAVAASVQYVGDRCGNGSLQVHVQARKGNGKARKGQAQVVEGPALLLLHPPLPLGVEVRFDVLLGVERNLRILFPHVCNNFLHPPLAATPEKELDKEAEPPERAYDDSSDGTWFEVASRLAAAIAADLAQRVQ